ncbi:bifunctional fucokinase/L-fucose-1-P-guanylyltransferase, partial [Parabacteroides sp. OttesenSCG-928-G07]|nr:bifunctional fucokinase/L-fucose-1-P-guanylyltransferase [Parabacteroides sp. OttesenSCG-928-G07]
NMFLNSREHLSLLAEMKAHAMDLYEAVQQGDFVQYGHLVKQTWAQNKALDSGTNPPEIEKIIALIDDYTLGYKLPGAGGGGFLYMVAKDMDAAAHIRRILTDTSLHPNARFVNMRLSQNGLQISRS